MTIEFSSPEAAQLFSATLHEFSPRKRNAAELESQSKELFTALTTKNLTPAQREALTAVKVEIDGCRRELAPSSSGDINRMHDYQHQQMHEALLESKKAELETVINTAHRNQLQREISQLENISRAMNGEEHVPYLGATPEAREKNAEKVREAAQSVTYIKADE